MSPDRGCFFFQAEDGIRDGHVTGVQTCALPIFQRQVGVGIMLETTYNIHDTNANLALNGQMYLYTADTFHSMSINGTAISPGTYSFAQLHSAYRSEERRVGKECRRWRPQISHNK